jgi:Amt family ammonium transporter
MIAAAIKNSDLLIAASTIWVVVTAVLVMFMQAGFAFLEAGLTRMKNAGHIAGKNVLIFGICSIVYWAVGFGLAFGDGGSLIGTHGFFPSVNAMIAVGQAPFDWFSEVPGAAGYLFEVVFAGVSLAIVWGAMAERAKLWVYFVFGVYFTLTYSIVSHWIWSPHGWLFSKGMQDFAGSTVVHLTGATAALGALLLLGPRRGKYGPDGKPRAIPGHSMPFVGLAVMILWIGWFGFNGGSTFGTADSFFGEVMLNTQLAAAAGVIGAVLVCYLKTRSLDVGMAGNGAIAGLVAITAPSGFVEFWAAPIIGLLAGVFVVYSVIAIERRLDDPVGALSAHGMAGIWGTISVGIFASPRLIADGAAPGIFYGIKDGGLAGSLGQLGVQALAVVATFTFVFVASYAVFAAIKATIGLRFSEEEELAGLDITTHGMYGYPESFIPREEYPGSSVYEPSVAGTPIAQPAKMAGPPSETAATPSA